ncbi:MAG: ABC transporter ATP-binding protein [Nitrosopumilaceae archaeon]
MVVSDNIAIRVSDLSRSFKIYHETHADVFSKLVFMLSGQEKYETLNVLDNLSFDVYKGEMLGIVGRNGSGKTTLLKIIGKIMRPSSGKVDTSGKISSFISLGSGLHPDLTVKQNIILYGMILGESKKDMIKKVDSVIKFAELEKFSDVRIKDFSVGMLMRLAFSIAISVEPDIVLIDEALSVGDYSFQKKSFNEFLRIKNAGRTVVFVSHNLENLSKLCDRVMLLDKGKIVEIGDPKQVVARYTDLMKLGTNPETVKDK